MHAKWMFLKGRQSMRQAVHAAQDKPLRPRTQSLAMRSLLKYGPHTVLGASVLCVCLVSCACPSREGAGTSPAPDDVAGGHAVEKPMTPRGGRLRPVDLLPEDEVRPVRVKNTRVIGKCTKEDFDGLVTLVGRLDLLSYDLLGVQVVWDIYPVAAQLFVGNNVIFCVKNREGLWEVRRVDRVIPASTSGLGDGTKALLGR